MRPQRAAGLEIIESDGGLLVRLNLDQHPDRWEDARRASPCSTWSPRWNGSALTCTHALAVHHTAYDRLLADIPEADGIRATRQG